MDKFALLSGLFVMLITEITSNNQLIAAEPFFHRVDVSVHGGFLLPHHKTMLHLTRGHFLMQQYTLSGQTRGVRPWHSTYNYPELGVSFLFSDLAYPEVLGFAYSVLPIVGFELFSARRFFVFSRYGAGLAWLSKSFNKENNYANNVIGQKLNIAIHSSLEARWNITPKWVVFSGLSFTHFSNGLVVAPNKGLNIPSVKMGINYNLQPERQIQKPPAELSLPRNPQVLFVATGGISRNYPPGSKALGRFSFNTTGNIPVTEKIRIGMGYDLFYTEVRIRENWEIIKEGYILIHGISIGFQQDFSRVAFILQKGIYLNNPYDVNKVSFYHRTGFRINPAGNIILNITIKTHFFMAETIEWGLGYKL